MCSLLLGAVAVPAFLLTGGAAGAAPGPTPTAPVRSAPAPLQVVLPGLLSVSADLPRVNIQILPSDSSARDRPPAAAPTSAVPAPTTGARPDPARVAEAAPVRPAPAAPRTSRASPGRPDRTPAARPTSFARPVAKVADDTVGNDRPRKTRAAAPKPRTPQAAAEAFQGMLRSGFPTWLLAGVVGLCALGTVLVVRSAGRRKYGVHRQP